MSAVKMAEGGDDTLIEGLGVPFGGPHNGKDIEGEYFTKSTDLALDWFAPGERPILYHHGLDADAGTTVVGRVTDYKATDLGVWTQAQLDRGSEYFDAIKQLVSEGKLYFSSGSMSHLVKRKKSGEITAWPWVELSLTPTPANLLAELDFSTAEKHFEAAGVKSATLDALKILSTGGDSNGGALVPEDNGKVIAKKPAPKASPKPTKDLPDGPTLMQDDDGGPYPEGSYEDLADDIARAMRRQVDGWPYVRATFPGYALVCTYDSDEGQQHYRVAYTLDEAGEPVLGEMERVQPAMIPADLQMPQADDAPLAIQSARLTEYAGLLIERTKGVQERRIKEGRILSTANRTRLADTADAMESALKALRDLLTSTEPQPAKAASVADDRTAQRLREFEGLKLWASVA